MSDTTPQPQVVAPKDDNVMAAVATLPIIGTIMYFAMKDLKPLAKFYAKQSIGLTALVIVQFVISFFTFIPFVGWFVWILSTILIIVEFIIWLVLIIKAFQGEMFRIPVMSDTIDKFIK